MVGPFSSLIAQSWYLYTYFNNTCFSLGSSSFIIVASVCERPWACRSSGAEVEAMRFY